MSEKEMKESGRKPVSIYQQLSGILNAYKTEEVTLSDAIKKLQLKERRASRPFCKVTKNGAIALHGLSRQPIVLYVEQWEALIKLVGNNYLENYIKYNESRIKRRPVRKGKKNLEEEEKVEEEFEHSEQVEQL